MITIIQLDECVKEADRFIERANQAKDMLIIEKVNPGRPRVSGNKLTGAVRRASLDLTRVLAELRRYR